jgi:hypothetical protein
VIPGMCKYGEFRRKKPKNQEISDGLV